MSMYDLLPPIETQFVDGDIPDVDYGAAVHYDIETSGLDPNEDELWVVNVGFSPTEDGTFQKAVVCRVVGQKSCPKNLKKLLEDPNVIKYIHNAPFDATWTYVKWGVHISSILCTQVLARFTRRRHNSYAKLTKLVTGYELPKGEITMSDWSLPFSEWSPQMKKYCAYDVIFGCKIYKYLENYTPAELMERYQALSSQWKLLVELLPRLKKHEDLRFIPH